MLGSFCKKMACVFGIVGFISSIFLAFKYGVTLKLLKDDYDYNRIYDDIKNKSVYERDFGKTIIIFLLAMLVVLVISIGLYTIGERSSMKRSFINFCPVPYQISLGSRAIS